MTKSFRAVSAALLLTVALGACTRENVTTTKSTETSTNPVTGDTATTQSTTTTKTTR